MRPGKHAEAVQNLCVFRIWMCSLGAFFSAVQFQVQLTNFLNCGVQSLVTYSDVQYCERCRLALDKYCIFFGKSLCSSSVFLDVQPFASIVVSCSAWRVIKQFGRQNFMDNCAYTRNVSWKYYIKEPFIFLKGVVHLFIAPWLFLSGSALFCYVHFKGMIVHM